MRNALLIALMLLPLPIGAQTCPQILLGNLYCVDGNPGDGCASTDSPVGSLDTTGSSLWIGVMTQENQQSPPMQNSMTTTSPTSTMTPLTYYDNVQIFYEYLPTTGTATEFQCTNSVGDNRFVCFFFAYSGVDNFDSGTDNGYDSVTGVNSVQPGAITPNQVYDLIVTAGFQQTDIGDLTVSSPFSIATIKSTVFNQGAYASDTYNSVSPINPTWTVGSGGGPALMAAAIAGFHPGIPGTTPGCPSGRLRGYVIHSK
jgi:hypothetical protein